MRVQGGHRPAEGGLGGAAAPPKSAIADCFVHFADIAHL